MAYTLKDAIEELKRRIPKDVSFCVGVDYWHFSSNDEAIWSIFVGDSQQAFTGTDLKAVVWAVIAARSQTPANLLDETSEQLSAFPNN